MTASEDLARRVRDVSRLTGEFVLRSGRVANEYFDKYQFEADPVLLELALESNLATRRPLTVPDPASLDALGSKAKTR